MPLKMMSNGPDSPEPETRRSAIPTMIFMTPPRLLLPPVHEGGPADRDEREDDPDRVFPDPSHDVLALPGEMEVEEHEQGPEQAEQEGEEREQAALGHRMRRRPLAISPFWRDYP